MNRLVPSALRLTILFFCSYGLLYYAYKNQDLALVGSDFFTYYNMYLSPLDLTAAEPPAVYRQLSAIAIHLVYRTGIYYPCAISMQVPGYDQHMFFAALLTNYLFLILAAWVAGAIVQQELATQAFVPATMAGLICLLSFYSQVAVLA